MRLEHINSFAPHVDAIVNWATSARGLLAPDHLSRLSSLVRTATQILDFEDYGVRPVLALDSAAQNPADCAPSGGPYVIAFSSCLP